jgi:DNA-binding NarL/FixJ family response regulator
MTSILLVEDHEVFAKALLRVLRERGHLDVVDVAGSAEEALEKIQELEVDLVLVDVSAEKSGLARGMKIPELPCVMLSGHFALCP